MYKDLLNKKFMPHLIEDGGIYIGNGYLNPHDRESSWREYELKKQCSVSKSQIKKETEKKETISKKDNVTILSEYLNIIKEINAKKSELANLETIKENLWNQINNNPELVDMINDMISTKKFKK